jgi:uncharacterized cupin superfamily protein
VGPFAVDPGASGAGIGGVSSFHITTQPLLNGFVGTTHGGVWRASVPSGTFGQSSHWESVTDQMACSSISVLAGAPLDSKVIVAGCGSMTSGDKRMDEPMGVMITIDNGET